MALKSRPALEADELKMELGNRELEGVCRRAGQRGDLGFEGSEQFYPLLAERRHGASAFEHLKCFSIFCHWPQKSYMFLSK